MTEPFLGAKLAILVGNQIVTILRDDIPTIPWPGHWDLPGGASEPGETPVECALRETFEELGLRMKQDMLIHAERGSRKGQHIWFFAAEWPDFRPEQVVFGDEGQEWRLAPIEWFLVEALAVPHQKAALGRYLELRKNNQ